MKGKLGRLALSVKGAVKRHWSWVLAVIGIALGAGGLYVALNQPQAVTDEQQELMHDVPPKVAWHCHPVDFDPNTSSLRDAYLIQAVVECESTDPGPEYVEFVSFASEANQRQHMRHLWVRSYREGFSCKADYLSRDIWTDATGAGRGLLLCDDGPHHANLLWSDTASATHFVAKAIVPLDEEDQLHRWWERDVKYEGDGMPRDAEQRLRAVVPPGFGRCAPGNFRVPGALVALSCHPGGGIDSAGVALFPNVGLLRKYIDTFASGYPGASRSKGCKVSTFAFTSWWLGGNETRPRGDLLCYVSGGTQWFFWTTDAVRVLAFAGRNDESWSRLWEAWRDRLSSIGSPHLLFGGSRDGVDAAAVQYEDAVPVSPHGTEAVGVPAAAGSG